MKTLSLAEINKLGGAWNRSEMNIKLQLVILQVTDHFNDSNSRSEIIKISLTEIGSGVGPSGSGLGIVTCDFEHCNKFRVPGKASFLKIFAILEQIRSK